MTACPHLVQCVWPVARVGEALEILAHRSGLCQHRAELPPLPGSLDATDVHELGRWVDWAARRIGVEAEPTATPFGGLASLLVNVAPALVLVPGGGDASVGFLVLLKARRQAVQLLGPDLRVHTVDAMVLAEALSGPVTAPFLADVDHVLNVAQVPLARRHKARQALLQEQLATQPIGHCWQIRTAPDAGFLHQVRQAQLVSRVGWMLLAFALLYLAEMAGWALMGRVTLDGRLDTGWLAGWALLVLSLVPLHLLAGWLDASFALDFGRLLKARLLAGILRSDLDAVRRQGAGQLLSQVMESQALEALALNGGMGVLVATLELGMAAWVLAHGAGGIWHLLLLLTWLGVLGVWSCRYFHRLREWTGVRLGLTHALVERMVGHRTRLAQEPLSRGAAQQDLALSGYLEASLQMDRAMVPATAVMPRGWMLLGLLGLLPAFVGGAASAADLAIALGGMLLANRALVGVSDGFAALSRAGVAWTQVSVLFGASVRSDSREPFMDGRALRGEPAHAREDQSMPVIDASQITFAYGGQAERVLNGVNLTIHAGDQILLEGPSGGGKSTLASLLVGLRKPQSGLLLLNGLDRHTLGDSWHQLTTEAPQFHENHILSATLAFNLLMGRSWPPSADELAEAQSLCEELGLGDLLARMPAGIMQMVGETGWQLSHGERSRIFLARALLQKAQLTVLDESFAALDPQTLRLCLDCAQRHTNALLVIAHPF